MTVKTRVTQLEKRTPDKPGLAIVFLDGDDKQPLPADVQAQRLAAAHAEVGENGLVVAIERDNTAGGKK